jgi:hypothetical protein
MTNPFWQEDDTDFSVTYPITEIMRRATLKLKIHDRNIPMTSDVWGMFPSLVGRFRRFSNWSRNGVQSVKVFYEPSYYVRNRYTVRLMDPLHLYHVTKYAAIKD